MRRRDFLRISAKASLALVALGGATVPTMLSPSRVFAADIELDLAISHALKEMVTGEYVDVWAWDFGSNGGMTTPGTTICATEGQSVTINVTNNHTIPHSFMVQGVPLSSTGMINPGETGSVTFCVPTAGTYMYGDPDLDALDPDDWTVSRVMGLAGVFISLPATGNTPYSNPTPQVQRLFNDLGNSPHFPGNPWVVERTWVWVFNSVDPTKNAAAQFAANSFGSRLSPETFKDGYLAQYFELSGKTGYFASHDKEILIWGNPGMPALIRCLNTGMATHSPHIHGNHVYEIFKNGEVQDNLFYLDTWTMAPGAIRDMLHPFIIPPDIVTWPPPDVTHPLFDEDEDIVEDGEGQPVNVTLSQFPVAYPMHCHNEISQTAAGGNYPQGLVTHWMFVNPNTDDPIDVETMMIHPNRELFRDFTRAD